MSRADAAAASDRLGWLSDEPKTTPRPAKRGGGAARGAILGRPLQRIRRGCAVVGLPWKGKVGR